MPSSCRLRSRCRAPQYCSTPYALQQHACILTAQQLQPLPIYRKAFSYLQRTLRTPLVCLQRLWGQLMVCRRSNFMALIPLTSQRLDQVAAASASLARQLVAQLAPLQPQLDRLCVFASANRTTAEELQAAGAAAEALVGVGCWVWVWVFGGGGLSLCLKRFTADGYQPSCSGQGLLATTCVCSVMGGMAWCRTECAPVTVVG